MRSLLHLCILLKCWYLDRHLQSYLYFQSRYVFAGTRNPGSQGEIFLAQFIMLRPFVLIYEDVFFFLRFNFVFLLLLFILLIGVIPVSILFVNYSFITFQVGCISCHPFGLSVTQAPHTCTWSPSFGRITPLAP